MAIAFDAVTGTQSATDSSITFAHTCSGNNRILIVGVWVDAGGGAVTGITYNGVAMTFIRDESNNGVCYLYYLIAPATGENNVVVTLNASGVIRAASASYTGVLQSGQPDSSNDGNGDISAGQPFSVSTTTIEDNCWLVGFERFSGGGLGAGDNTVIRGTPSNSVALADSNGAKSPAGSHSLNWTTGAINSRTYMAIVASISPDSITSIKSVNGLSYASVKSYNGLAVGSIKNINGLS